MAGQHNSAARMLCIVRLRWQLGAGTGQFRSQAPLNIPIAPSTQLSTSHFRAWATIPRWPMRCQQQATHGLRKCRCCMPHHAQSPCYDTVMNG